MSKRKTSEILSFYYINKNRTFVEVCQSIITLFLNDRNWRIENKLVPEKIISLLDLELTLVHRKFTLLAEIVNTD